MLSLYRDVYRPGRLAVMTDKKPQPSFYEILSPISEPLKKVEELVIENLESQVPLLTEIAKYIMEAGGKRVRPALVLLSAAVVGEITEETCKAANIVEYLHTASLLHDDVVDNADLRRSKKTARTVWGNEASVLVGDYLFAFSFKYLGSLNNPKLFDVLSTTATQMTSGEIIQLSMDNTVATEQDYLDVIFFKTASLMSASMEMGAILGGGTEEQQKVLAECGKNIGMAFQLVDDALDYDINNIAMGKKQGTDLKERKITLPLNHLLNTARPAEISEVKAILEGDTITDQHVNRVCELIAYHKSNEYTLGRAVNYTKEVKNLLSEFPDNVYSTSIAQLADFIVYRKL